MKTKTTPVSRQRRYQLRHAARGLCMLCPLPVKHSRQYCARHAEADRIARRRRSGSQPWRPGKPGRPPGSLTGGGTRAMRAKISLDSAKRRMKGSSA